MLGRRSSSVAQIPHRSSSLPHILVGSPPTSSNFQTEVFHYDEHQLQKWAVPVELKGELPAQLDKTIANWQCAGAAIASALDRIHELNKSSIDRGWPTGLWLQHPQPPHTLKLSSGDNSEAMPDTPSTGPMNTPSTSSIETIHESLLSEDDVLTLTPLDTPTSITPVKPDDDDNGGENGQIIPVMNADQLAKQLLPKSRADSVVIEDNISEPGSSPGFHEVSWNNFINAYESELVQLRKKVWPRFRDWTYRVERSRTESSLAKGTARKFDDWWVDMKVKHTKIQDEVSTLRAPNLEVVKLERATMGLSI